ncbi:MAG TPA: sodium/proton-translocating pyrophosphatase, partial [Parachlamydiaceae bacterium]|nr:sodium/proton-translocating pyrophosphatase [Parachlamydiaceae bacterium]
MTRSILSLSTGTPKMQEIAAAIQEGARAYLNRQYQVITVVGIVICTLLTWLLGMYVGIGFIIG